MSVPPDIEIARAATLQPIGAVAERLGIPEDALHQYGRHIAKLDLGYLRTLEEAPPGRLVLVTAISPTPAGEGKTTTTVGLGDGLNRIGKRAAICLREPSLGPCFGMKGGAAGGGYAQVVPMEQINLHFTGDFHAIGSAHNLLAALLDNHLYWGNELGIDERRVAWRRCLDMNDRALRQIVSSLGGVANGFPREDGFDITVASEVMAVFCLARDLADLEARLGRMVVAHTRERKAVTAADLKAHGAMTVLLRDAVQPNLVQTLEGNPAFVHGGPFANIAHGCNSVMATRTALRLADYVVTEAGFGADLGAEKFFDIKCRKAGLTPSAAVIVATVRALEDARRRRPRGSRPREPEGAGEGPGQPRPPRPQRAQVRRAVGRGDQPLQRRHRGRARAGPGPLPPRCWASRPSSASTGPRARPASRPWPATWSTCATRPTRWTAWASPTSTPTRCRSGTRCAPSPARSTGPRTSSPTSASATSSGTTRPRATATSRSASPRPSTASRPTPTSRGAPSGHVVPIRELRLAGGAEFLVVICGEIMTMPGLPRTPAAHSIRLDEEGRVEGLF